MSGLLLTVTDEAGHAPATRPFPYLDDGDDLIVLASKTAAENPRDDYLARLAAAPGATVELVPDAPFEVDVVMLAPGAARTDLLDRLLRHAPLDERHDIRRGGHVPIARLTPRGARPAGGTSAFSGVAESRGE